MKRALLFVYEPTHFNELIRVARVLRESGRYEPKFMFALGYRLLPRDVETCRREGFSFGATNASILPSAEGVETREEAEFIVVGIHPLRLPRPLRFLFFRAYNALSYVSSRLGKGLVDYRREMRRASQLLAKEKPDILVFAEDNIGHGTEIWIHLAKRRGVGSIVVPFTICNALELANHFAGVPLYSLSRPENRVVGTLFPKWIYSHNGERLLRLPGGRALALELHGTSPERPWMINSGAAQAIAAESLAMKSYYEREGIPTPQLVVTGALYDDVLSEHLRDAEKGRERLFRELDLPSGKPLLLLALPPELNTRMYPRSDFASYAGLVDYLLAELRKLKHLNAVVCLHPATPKSVMEERAGFGVRWTRQDTASLVPLSDLYIASCSATIRWAIACGKPVLNFDLHRFKYSDYVDVPGCITVEGREEFEQQLKRLTSDASYLAGTREKQEECMHRWGRLDGKASVRMIELFDQVSGCSIQAVRPFEGVSNEARVVVQ